jgi:hypothetical protein
MPKGTQRKNKKRIAKVLLKTFLENPDDFYSNSDYSKWDINTYQNCHVLLMTLHKKHSGSHHIEKISKMMAYYMKFCYDHDKYFPWEENNIDKEEFAEQFKENV